MSSFATSSIEEQRRFLRRHLVWPALFFIGLAVIFELSSIDRTVSSLLFEPERGFIASDSWWANELLHTGGVRLVALVGLSAITVSIAGFASSWARQRRRAALFVVLTILLGTGIVSMLKNTTNVDCPRQLDIFNGDRPYVRLFERKPAGLPRGVCWPGGHSSGAFSLFSLYLVLRDRSHDLAVLTLLAVIALGSCFAFAQWARGAHFVSHDFWSAGICWFVSMALYLLVFRGTLSSGGLATQND